MTSALRGHRASESYLQPRATQPLKHRAGGGRLSCRITRGVDLASDCEHGHREPHASNPGYRDTPTVSSDLFSPVKRILGAHRSGDEYLIPKVLDLLDPTIPRPSPSLILELPNRLQHPLTRMQVPPEHQPI
jgi:hypothetical protein